ncbi:hypothetical protein J4402_00850 [Candidatus Pacearchaeota archaeon]|nr:hypothetical protein [Candidatus Pacearchaeota archaeon]
MNIGHSTNCTIYDALAKGRPENGICTCGFGLSYLTCGSDIHLYSSELRAELEHKKSQKIIAGLESITERRSK